jgi:hypothetical protein
LKRYKQNEHAEAVLIVGHSNWHELIDWFKPNLFRGEAKSIIRYLEKRKETFSFYLDASPNDIEKIMEDKNVREVYFCGHGSSHSFRLDSDWITYYCEFNNQKYRKDFIYQVHCGTKYGKNPADYNIIPEENKNKCLMPRKPITYLGIRREFNRRTKKLI